MGLSESPSVGDILKQAYTAHRSVKNGLQLQITKLQQKIVDLEKIIASRAVCPQCNCSFSSEDTSGSSSVEVVNHLPEQAPVKKHRNKRNKNEQEILATPSTSKNSQSYSCIDGTAESPQLFDDDMWLQSWNRTDVRNNKQQIRQTERDSPSLLDESTFSRPKNIEEQKTTTLEKPRWEPYRRAKANGAFKFKSDPVRNRDERAKMTGYGCTTCKRYYSELELSEEELKDRLKLCSKHRDHYTPPATPADFWRIDFPSTQECKDKGRLNQTQYRPLKGRRKRLLTTNSND